MAQDIIKLNVGGHKYITTKQTLSKVPSSMLGAMFNGSFHTAVDSEGYHFIDRDGHLFQYVLNFLRSMRLALPDDFKHFDQLAVEADFFQIEPLIQALNDLKPKPRSQQNLGCIVEVIEVRTGSTAVMPTSNSRIKTIISGRCGIIKKLPAVIGPIEKLQHINDAEFVEFELKGSNIRLRLAEYLYNYGWSPQESNVTSSSGYDTKSMISSLIIEQTYRDRWFLPESTLFNPEPMADPIEQGF